MQNLVEGACVAAGLNQLNTVTRQWGRHTEIIVIIIIYKDIYTETQLNIKNIATHMLTELAQQTTSSYIQCNEKYLCAIIIAIQNILCSEPDLRYNHL